MFTRVIQADGTGSDHAIQPQVFRNDSVNLSNVATEGEYVSANGPTAPVNAVSPLWPHPLRAPPTPPAHNLTLPSGVVIQLAGGGSYGWVVTVALLTVGLLMSACLSMYLVSRLGIVLWRRCYRVSISSPPPGDLYCDGEHSGVLAYPRADHRTSFEPVTALAPEWRRL